MSKKERAILEARNLIQELNIRDTPVDVNSVAQQLSVDIVTASLEDEVSGMLITRNGRAVIGINERHHPHRQRFTIAHELGHFVLHSGESKVFVDSTVTYYRDGNSSEGVYLQEIAANSFAAELLMPKNFIKQYFEERQLEPLDEQEVKRLASRFDVSEQAMTIRLVNLGLVEV